MGDYVRPPTSSGRRPPSASGMRPGTGRSRGGGSAMALGASAMGRPPVANALPPGSARPGTRGGMQDGAGLNTEIRVVDRPMTRQGLSGMKTGSKGPQRQVQDKSYFIGQLRSKVMELNTENARMEKEIEKYEEENATYVTYEKRAEGLANEIKELQGQLADYNTLLDKVNTDTPVDDIIQDCNDLKDQNERERKNIDTIFTQRRDKEEQIKQLNIEIDQERRMAESLVEDMAADMKKKYIALKNTNHNLEQELEKKQQDLDVFTTRAQRLEEELSASPVKQEAVSLYEKLHELEGKKQSLIEEFEQENKGTPAEERERLLKQVKEDNQEIASMERRVTELREKIEETNNELQQLEMDLEESQGEKNVKYKELKKREQTMNEFLEGFDENKKAEMERKQQLEASVVTLLEHFSRGMIRSKHMPSPAELKQMQDDLNFKENEMHKSQATTMGLAGEHTRLQMDLEKVEQLETKITDELESLKKKYDTMTKELETYGNLDKLREEADDKKRKLYEEQKILDKRREVYKSHVNDLAEQYESDKTKLADNETHSQLGNLERKWQHLELNNFVIKEFIATKTMESDYKGVKDNVIGLSEELNSMLVQNLNKK